jgi:hypothetical protein
MRRGLLFLGTFLMMAGSALAGECGGKGYTGRENSYCLSCHSGCPTLHVVSEVEVKETECLKVPSSFPLKDGRMVCTTCHDMTSDNKDFLRAKKKLKERFDFCFQCHNPECYKKFNPHETIAKNIPWDEKKKACIYCHGVGAKLEAYKACVGCHTKTPHVGAPEHLLASIEKVRKITQGKEGIVDIYSIKELKPKLDEEVLKERKPKVILVRGKIECITCHNPHPQIAVIAPPMARDWSLVAQKEIDYELKVLKEELNKLELNTGEVKLMSGELRGGRLCRVCHSINSLK